MSYTLNANLTDAQREQVSQKLKLIYEANTPALTEIKASSKKRSIDEAGYRIRRIEVLPGGHGFYRGASSGYNEPYPMQTMSTWVYPVRYALSMQYDVALLESLKEGKSEMKVKLLEAIEKHNIAVAKRMNQLIYGDGSGAIAYAGSSHVSTGAATLTGATSPAATPGQTKGTLRLEKGHRYQAINASTGAVRGTFTVTTPGKATAVINIESGTITSGDPIVDVGSYLNAPRGFGHLISGTNRILQGIDTTLHPEFNNPEIDLNGSTLTPADIDDAKVKLQTRLNDENGVALKCFMTAGQYAVLRKQGFGFRQYEVDGSGGGNVSTGIANKYIENGVKFINDADCDDDRLYLKANDYIESFIEKEVGLADWDSQEWRMWLGSNGYGSDIYMRALTWRGNYGVGEETEVPGAGAVLIKRANTTNVVQQYNS